MSKKTSSSSNVISIPSPGRSLSREDFRVKFREVYIESLGGSVKVKDVSTKAGMDLNNGDSKSLDGMYALVAKTVYDLDNNLLFVDDQGNPDPAFVANELPLEIFNELMTHVLPEKLRAGGQAEKNSES